MNVKAMSGILMFYFVLCGCLVNDSNIMKIINIQEGMNNLSDIRLSEVCKKISYVPLETLDSVLIGKYPKINVVSNKILVSSNRQPLFVFDKQTGKYLNKIGHRGDDPEAYVDDGWGNVSYWVDKKTELVYFQSNDMKGMLKYDMEGRFVDRIELPLVDKMDLYSSELFIDNDTIWLYNKLVSDRETPVLICFSGEDGELYWKKETDKEVLPSFDKIVNVEYLFGNQIDNGGDQYKIYYADNKIYTYTPNASSFCKIDGRLIFKECFVDTLYQLNQNEKSYYKSFDLGDFTWPYEQRCVKEVSEKRLYVDYVYGNNNILLAHLTQGLYGNRDRKKEYTMVYMLDKGVVRMSQNNVLINDIDSLMDVSIWGASGNELFACLFANDFIVFKEQNEHKFCRDEFKELSFICSEDNPIIAFFE